jgi:PASTA domain
MRPLASASDEAQNLTMRPRLGKRLVVALVAGCALVVFGTAGASAARPQPTSGRPTSSRPSAAADPQATLTVTVTGTGTGWVTSSPAGISCGTVCSAQFPLNTSVQLKAQSATGSMFAAPWTTVSGSDCNSETHGGVGNNYCETLLEGDTAVQAAFNLDPKSCWVPGVTSHTLAWAKTRIKQAHCAVGTVTHAFSSVRKKGRVISQNPHAHWRNVAGSKVNLVVSKGTRKPTR